jgi:hypothetical protein
MDVTPNAGDRRRHALSTRVHGVLDYMSAALFFMLPRLLNWSENVTSLLTMLAVGVLVYSLLTEYDLGAFHALPMRAHLALDFMGGALLVACALFLPAEPAGVRALLAALGIFEVCTSMITNPEPELTAERGVTFNSRARGF